MTTRRYSVTRFCLTLGLSASFMSHHVLAAGRYQKESVRAYTVASGSPIGVIESLGSMAINGQVLCGSGFIWGGELLQAPNDTNARVFIHSVGRVTLSRGASARLATKLTASGASRVRPVLIASLLGGEMLVTLRPDASAYAEACGGVFVASGGACFQVSVREGGAVIETRIGVVTVESQSTQARYTVKPVGIGSAISVRARSTRQIQVQVTDEHDNPVPDLPVPFILGGAGGKSVGTLGVGTLTGTSFTATTDAKGIASVPFNAGGERGSDSITATIEGTRVSWTAQITVTPTPWTKGRTALVVVLLAAAGAGAGVAIAKAREKEPITLQPPQVRP